MKKIIIALLCLSSIASCRKPDKSFEEAAVPITSQSAQNQIDFANKHLKQITEGIALLAKDKDFVSFVQTEAKKKFDGEYEVLIQDLQKNSTWRQKMNMPIINNALNAFKNIEGANYYPQIYIPKFQHEEDMKADNNYTSTNSIILPEIVYIYYSGDSEVDSATNTNDSYAGYILDSATNQLVYWGMVNEAYANDNEVWIISVNESVGNGGNFCPPEFVNGVNQYCPESLTGCCTGGGGGGGGGTPPCSGPDCDPLEYPSLTTPIHPDMGTHFPVNCKIENMIVREHKEHWLSGASEIAIRAKLHCHNNLEYGAAAPAPYQPYKSDQFSNYLGKRIDKFKRREINRQTVKFVNYSLQTNWPVQFYRSDPVYFDYVIFERDLWPATKNEAIRLGRRDTYWPPYGISQAWEQFYRSKQKTGTFNGEPYKTGSFVSNNLIAISQNEYYATGSVNNAYISFNTVGY
jgi:hypothetical protein